MQKIRKYSLRIVGCIFVSATILYIFMIMTRVNQMPNIAVGRAKILLTQAALEEIRYAVNKYYEIYGRYPSTLSDMENIIKTKSNKDFNLPKEYITQARISSARLPSDNGIIRETKEYDNGGGWFYDAQNGKVSINATNELRSYIKSFRFKKLGKDIPSSW